eukprot:snap_masked-scaffold_58-processed-gene-0.70-mRNA-1 protein AED:1.00 eAED:1.00 QI:0/0/0/0/1/1/3/0/420
MEPERKKKSNSKRQYLPDLETKATEIYESLRVLNFEDVEDQDKSGVTLSAETLAHVSCNPGAQWKNFLTVFAFMVNDLRSEPFLVSDLDDPSSLCNTIFLILKELGFDSDFPASALRTGFGKEVIEVLLFLKEKALETENYVFGEPQVAQTLQFEDIKIDIEADLELLEEKTEDLDSSSEISEHLEAQSEQGNSGRSKCSIPNKKILLKNDALQNYKKALVLDNKWKKEVAKNSAVLLRLTKKGVYSKVMKSNWALHLSSSSKSGRNLTKLKRDLTERTNGVGQILEQDIEFVKEKEIDLNMTNKEICSAWQSASKDEKVMLELEANIASEVEDLNGEMLCLTNELEQVKEKMDKRSNMVSDTKPLKELKDSIGQLQREIKVFDIEMQVITHTLNTYYIETRARKLKLTPNDKFTQGYLY